MSSTLTKNELLTTTGSLKNIVNRFKVANEGGVLGPEEVKEIAEETIAVISDAAQMIENIADGVPAVETSSPLSDDRGVGDSGIGGGDDTGDDGDKKPIVATDDEDEEKKLMRSEIASLKKQMDDIKLASAKEKLASEYASLWPLKQAKAKHASFMKTTGSLEILQAKLDEAKSIMSSSNVKQASMPRSDNGGLYDSFSERRERIASNKGFDASQITMKV